jgi:hypothetical protein
MNQRPQGLNITKSITGFSQYKVSDGISPNARRVFNEAVSLMVIKMGVVYILLIFSRCWL